MSWDADVRQIRMNFKYTLNKTICYQLDSLLQPNCIFNVKMDQEDYELFIKLIFLKNHSSQRWRSILVLLR